ncbi:MAG: methionyl-tRNA formyltransferase [Candidatus Marinimicrobia bacterium]|nr:methionyl-tRNA formyltransferase [Candidatus Neomarinimicrobiota bacterium]
MNIVFMGNPQFSVPALKAITGSNHQILAVVTNPPKQMGRGRSLQPTPVGIVANELGLSVIPAIDLKSKNLINELVDLKPDIFVVIAYRILPDELINIPKIGAINLHTSLLPKYRGAAPIQHALMNGDTETGVTTFLIQRKVDTGNILLQESCIIDDQNDYGSLSEKLSLLGAKLLVRTLDKIERGDLGSQPQDHTLSTPAPKILPLDCIINWNNSAQNIHNQIRGLSPTPTAFTFFKNKRLKLFKTDCVKTELHGKIGSIVHLTKSECYIQTGDGVLSILECQKEGKSRMNIQQFLLGSNLSIGDQFSSE